VKTSKCRRYHPDAIVALPRKWLASGIRVSIDSGACQFSCRQTKEGEMSWLDWDEFADEYDAVFLEDPVYISLLQLALEQVEGIEGKRVLDLGCGTGNFTFQLLRKFGGATVLGVDPSEGMRELYAGRFEGNPNVSVSKGNGTAIPAADGEFDCIVTSLTLHHVPRESKGDCAIELARVLKPGGRLVYADRFCDVDGPPGDADRARDLIEKMSGWALYCLEHGAYRKALLIIESIPNDLLENGEIVVSAGSWLERLAAAGFSDLSVSDVPPARFGLKVICGKRD
jgi:ubiquinone/menaquinone biosynthesis C-methylase UbiE